MYVCSGWSVGFVSAGSFTVLAASESGAGMTSPCRPRLFSATLLFCSLPCIAPQSGEISCWLLALH